MKGVLSSIKVLIFQLLDAMRKIFRHITLLTLLILNASAREPLSPLAEINSIRSQIIRISDNADLQNKKTPLTHTDDFTLSQYYYVYSSKTKEPLIAFILYAGADSKIPDWKFWADLADTYKFQIDSEEKSFEELQETHGFSDIRLLIMDKCEDGVFRPAITYQRSDKTWLISNMDGSDSGELKLNRDGNPKYQKTQKQETERSNLFAYRRYIVNTYKKKYENNPNISVGYNTKYRTLIFDILDPTDNNKKLFEKYTEFLGAMTVADMINGDIFEDIIINIAYKKEGIDRIRGLSLVFKGSEFDIEGTIDSGENRYIKSIPDRLLTPNLLVL